MIDFVTCSLNIQFLWHLNEGGEKVGHSIFKNMMRLAVVSALLLGLGLIGLAGVRRFRK